MELGHLSWTEKAANTVPSGLRSAISEKKNVDKKDNKQKNDVEIEKRAETQENVKFHFQAPLMVVQIFPWQIFSSPSTIKLFPEPKICFFFKIFRSTALGLLSRRSNLVSKRKRNEKLTAKIFWVRLTSSKEEIPWKKDPTCHTKQQLTTKR